MVTFIFSESSLIYSHDVYKLCFEFTYHKN